MFSKSLLLSFILSASTLAQQIGKLQTETHPKISVKQCTAGKSCTTQSRPVVLDSNWRWTHSTANSTNCYDGNEWDTTLCPDPTTCAKNCAIDGADYQGTYGITASGEAVKLVFVTKGQYSTNIGSRVYLMADDNNYQTFDLRNQEFTFDVDVSNLPCGLNGAVYFVEMPKDGGKSAHAAAGAGYGTGYCDSQCPHDIKWINGAANVLDWEPSDNDVNAGKGRYGACCAEMDIWEANSQATAYTPHVCTTQGLSRCEGTACGDGDQRYNGVCDKDGCDFNSWRMGDQTFYGAGKTVDTSKPFTIVTQFIGSGTITEIRRKYVQNGKVIENSSSKVTGVTGNSITDKFCQQQKTAFGDTPSFEDRGGLQAMSQSFSRGMVLVMSLWDDHEARMLWLDSNYPTDASATKPGISRGPCATTSGDPKDVESQYPGASVTYSNIRYGPIDSTY